MNNRSSLSLAGKAATLAVTLEACAPVLAETRLLGASYSHYLHPGTYSTTRFNGMDRPWHEHKALDYSQIEGCLNNGVSSEAWGDATTQMLTDGVSLDVKLRTRTTLGVNEPCVPWAQAGVEFKWRIEVIGQEETVTFDTVAINSNVPEEAQGGRVIVHGFEHADGGASLLVGGERVDRRLQPGLYEITLNCDIFDTDADNAGHDWHNNFATSVHFTNMTIARGAFQHVPFLPGPGGEFGGVHGGGWFDPPMAQGYTFTATGTSLFKDIMAFPAGIEGTYYITTEGSTYGPFTPEDSVNFPALVGHSVSSFVLKGIKPFVDGTSPTAFPIMLDFSEPTASFTMLPIPAPEIQLEPLANGDLKLIFTGVLQSSPDLAGWADVVPAPPSPYIIPKAQLTGKKYFRARD